MVQRGRGKLDLSGRDGIAGKSPPQEILSRSQPGSNDGAASVVLMRVGVLNPMRRIDWTNYPNPKAGWVGETPCWT